jgi:tRNA threonylcarbamoyladenosine biosynthesis protein TsaE
VHHVDAYRLSDAWDLVSVGGDDLFSDDAVTLIEWPERVADLLERPHLRIEIHHAREGRRLSIRAAGGFPDGRADEISARARGGTDDSTEAAVRT